MFVGTWINMAAPVNQLLQCIHMEIAFLLFGLRGWTQ